MTWLVVVALIIFVLLFVAVGRWAGADLRQAHQLWQGLDPLPPEPPHALITVFYASNETDAAVDAEARA